MQDAMKTKSRLIEMLDNAANDPDEAERLRMVLAAALRDADVAGLVFLGQCLYGLVAIGADRNQ